TWQRNPWNRRPDARMRTRRTRTCNSRCPASPTARSSGGWPGTPVSWTSTPPTATRSGAVTSRTLPWWRATPAAPAASSPATSARPGPTRSSCGRSPWTRTIAGRAWPAACSTASPTGSSPAATGIWRPRSRRTTPPPPRCSNRSPGTAAARSPAARSSARSTSPRGDTSPRCSSGSARSATRTDRSQPVRSPTSTCLEADMDIFARLESEVRGYCRGWPTVFTTAQGSHMTDENGKTYLDFFAGAGTLNYGHNNPQLKRRLMDYLARDAVVRSLDMYSAANREFLERFNEYVLEPRGLDYKIQFPGPAGNHSVEAALKLARKYTGRETVVSFTNAFHGMTLGALAV